MENKEKALTGQFVDYGENQSLVRLVIDELNCIRSYTKKNDPSASESFLKLLSFDILIIDGTKKFTEKSMSCSLKYR